MATCMAIVSYIALVSAKAHMFGSRRYFFALLNGELNGDLYGTYVMVLSTSDSQLPKSLFTNTSKGTNKSVPTPIRTPSSVFTNTSKGIPTPLRTPKDFCTKTSAPAVYIICTWDIKIDQSISGHIHKTGKWESHITQKLYSVLKQDRKITFIDIGANIGYFSLLAASVGQSVVSVEPWKLNIEKLQQSIRENKFEGRITVLNNAVSNNRRVIHIHAPFKKNLGATRVLSDPTATGPNVFSAESITLNELANYTHTKDVVIKIDIEGNECRALENSEVIFEKFNVLFISMEWEVMKMFQNDIHTACPPENIRQMVEMLTNRDFVPHSFFDKFPLNPVEYKKWTHVDIYWVPKNAER